MRVTYIKVNRRLSNDTDRQQYFEQKKQVPENMNDMITIWVRGGSRTKMPSQPKVACRNKTLLSHGLKDETRGGNET